VGPNFRYHSERPQHPFLQHLFMTFLSKHQHLVVLFSREPRADTFPPLLPRPVLSAGPSHGCTVRIIRQPTGGGRSLVCIGFENFTSVATSDAVDELECAGKIYVRALVLVVQRPPRFRSCSAPWPLFYSISDSPSTSMAVLPCDASICPLHRLIPQSLPNFRPSSVEPRPVPG